MEWRTLRRRSTISSTACSNGSSKLRLQFESFGDQDFFLCVPARVGVEFFFSVFQGKQNPKEDFQT